MPHNPALCPDRDTLVTYLTDDLPFQDDLAIRNHLAGCAACRERALALLKTFDLPDDSGPITDGDWD